MTIHMLSWRISSIDLLSLIQSKFYLMPIFATTFSTQKLPIFNKYKRIKLFGGLKPVTYRQSRRHPIMFI